MQTFFLYSTFPVYLVFKKNRICYVTYIYKKKTFFFQNKSLFFNRPTMGLPLPSHAFNQLKEGDNHLACRNFSE